MSGTVRVVCEDCGERPTLVWVDDGAENGVECGCERSDGTPIGTYVEPANFPGQWSTDHSDNAGNRTEADDA